MTSTQNAEWVRVSRVKVGDKVAFFKTSVGADHIWWKVATVAGDSFTKTFDLVQVDTGATASRCMGNATKLWKQS